MFGKARNEDVEFGAEGGEFSAHQSSVSTDGRRLQVPKSESSVSATHAMHLSPRHMHALSDADIENGQTLFFAFTSIIQLRINIFHPPYWSVLVKMSPFTLSKGT